MMVEAHEHSQDVSSSPIKTTSFAAAIQGFAYSPSPSQKRAAPTSFCSPEFKRSTRSRTQKIKNELPSQVPSLSGDSPDSKYTPPSPALSLSPQSSDAWPSSLPPSASKKNLRKRKVSALVSLSPPASHKTTAKRKKSTGYAPPSTYSHLPNLLKDALSPGLICVFIGVNPGLNTAATGHAYSHFSNLFWKFLYSSGCTPRRCLPSETYALPELYGLGNTNIVERATKNAAELSKQEMDAGVEHLERKVRECKPESVAIVGKGIWESIWRVRHGRKIANEEFRYGWQDEAENMGKPNPSNEDDGWTGARVFVATSTSGLAAGLRPEEKEAIWRPFGQWVKQRREEKGLVGDRRLVDGVVVKVET